MSYMNALISIHHMSWQHIWSALPVVLGFTLLEADNERRGKGGINYVARHALAAMRELEERLNEEYHIVEEAAAHGS